MKLYLYNVRQFCVKIMFDFIVSSNIFSHSILMRLCVVRWSLSPQNISTSLRQDDAHVTLTAQHRDAYPTKRLSTRWWQNYTKRIHTRQKVLFLNLSREGHGSWGRRNLQCLNIQHLCTFILLRLDLNTKRETQLNYFSLILNRKIFFKT